MNLIEACAEPRLFAPWFKNPETWVAWDAVLRAIFGVEAADDCTLEIFKELTGRERMPTVQAKEVYLCCGRRAGKSFTVALVGVYLALFKSYTEHLARGERATVLIIAADRRQARVIWRYARALINETPLLAGMVEKERAESMDFNNSVTLEIGTASFRSTRGYSFAAVLVDEIAFFSQEGSTNPDDEIIDAIRPGLSNLPGSMLLCASSPYSRRGVLHDAFKRYWSVDNDRVLFVKAPTLVMNPTIDPKVVEEALERDFEKNRAEYLAEFRTDIAEFVSRDAVEACVEPDCRERPPERGIIYYAAVDPSGGSADSWTACVAHTEKDDTIVIDMIREFKPPFSPEQTVHTLALDLERYGVRKVHGDRYAGEFPRELFRKRSITYDLLELPKSGLYQNLLPVINGRRVSLLDHPRSINQICNLERRTARGGRDSIDHPPGGHDDIANAIAAAVYTCQGPKRRGETYHGIAIGYY